MPKDITQIEARARRLGLTVADMIRLCPRMSRTTYWRVVKNNILPDARIRAIRRLEHTLDHIAESQS